jgi:HSP20 family protein
MRRRIVPWGPFPEMMSLREAMDRLLQESFVRTPRRLMEPILGHELAVDVYETDQEVVVRTAVPGARPEDLDITVMGDTLTIKCQTEEDPEVKNEQYIRREMHCGAFSRSVTLPSGLEPDKAEATFEAGVLTLTIPKAEEIQPKIIPVKTK